MPTSTVSPTAPTTAAPARTASEETMRQINYGGELAAITTSASVHLAPAIDELPAGDPRRRFVAVMCLYSRDVDAGEVPAPYSDEDAERYARCVLIDDEQFGAHRGESDEALAERFAVPLEQIAAKREDSTISALLELRDRDQEKQRLADVDDVAE